MILYLINGKRRRNSKLKKKLLQFNILNFKESNYYLFNVTSYTNIIYGITDKNCIKINNEELQLFLNEIDVCNQIKSKSAKNNIIEIQAEFFNFFNNYEKRDLHKSEYAQKINYIIDYLRKQKENLTLKKICMCYDNFYKKKISITTASRILKNHLSIKYLKTSIKNPKLEENNYIFMSFIFLRIFFRILLLKLNIIYVDETGFVLSNDNYYTWRKSDEQIYDGPKTKMKERLNLILAVSNKKVLHKKYVKGSVNANVFKDFLEDLVNLLSDEEKNKTLIIYDNATYHLTKDIISFFKENQIKGLTICPYRSNFNMIELVFRYVKNIIYKNVYERIGDLKADVDKILDGENIKSSLINLYKETLLQYVLFIQNYNSKDLNIINN